ncbi:MAG: amidohydrolase family protein, partial [Chloroflexota bacterium]|nr:amidohydrolase family protein [Chloroflexota bacterium]
MTDLAIRGGLVVVPEGALERDLLVSDGRIQSLVAPGAGTASDELDARGLVVFPGVVDAHVHFNDPGRADWEGWERGTRGAAAGGVTTVCDMPLNSIPPTTTAQAFRAKRAAAEGGAHVDFALWGGLTPDADVAALHALGVVGVKAFLCDSGVPEFPRVDIELISRTPGLVAVHAEDPALLLGRGASWARSR